MKPYISVTDRKESSIVEVSDINNNCLYRLTITYEGIEVHHSNLDKDMVIIPKVSNQVFITSIKR